MHKPDIMTWHYRRSSEILVGNPSFIAGGSKIRKLRDKVETVESVMEVANCEFLHGFSASFRRVTPSTHVGRLSGPRFELGFSVRLNCHVGKDGEGTARRRGRHNSIV